MDCLYLQKIYCMKTCSKCKIKKELTEFRVDNSKKDGLRPDCKSCGRRVIEKPKHELQLYYENKRRLLKEKRKEYTDAHKEAKREYDKQYRLRKRLERKL